MRSFLCFLLLLQALPAPDGDVRGRILLKTGAVEGALDVQSGGRRGGEICVLVIDAEKVPMMKDFGSLQWDDLKGLSFHYTKLPLGKRLFTAGWRNRAPRTEQYGDTYPTHYLAWQWVDVKAPDPKGTSSEIILTVSPAACGDVEVSVRAGVAAESISFLPADEEGRVPDWSDRRYGAAYEERVRNGKAAFKGLKPGKYVFYPTPERSADGVPALTTAAEVKAKSVTSITLGGEK